MTDIIVALIGSFAPTMLVLIAYLSLRDKANAAKDIAETTRAAAVELAEDTHKIVNQQRTDMMAEIDKLKEELATLKGTP